MKVVLIIDKPDACYECPCYRQNHYGGFFEDCKATYIPLSPTEVDDIPDWCPLRPLPEKMSWGHTADYIYGFNDCLDEITGETK